MYSCSGRDVSSFNAISLNNKSRKGKQVSSSPASRPTYHQKHLPKFPRRGTRPQGEIKSNTKQSEPPGLEMVSKVPKHRPRGILEASASLEAMYSRGRKSQRRIELSA